MTIKTILPFGDPILRKQAKPVEELTPKLLRLLDDMAETLYAADGRAGLAAPQVGILRRLVVLDCGDGLIELINPRIVESTGAQSDTEACLSFPGYAGVVERASMVKVSTLMRTGEEQLLEGEGFLARCLQHEIDHLDGVLFIDYMKAPWLQHEHTGERVALTDVRRLAGPSTLR